MAVPASYTEKALAEYMASLLGAVVTVLGLTVGASDAGDYEEAVNDTLLAYGTDDISSVSGRTNIQKLRVIAKAQAWQLAVNNFAAYTKFSADGGSYDRNQLFEQAKQNLADAEVAAMAYDANYAVRRRSVDAMHDPYQVRTDDERVL